MAAECPDENLILAHIDGKLSADEVADMDRHLDACSPCRHILCDLARARTSSLFAPGSPEVPPPAPADLGAAPEPPLLRPGATIGRYHILRWIGSGGMGVVYAAYDPALDRRIALKLVRPEWQRAGSDGRALLQREAKSLARLSHPNVVVIYDVGTIGEQLFIAMEYIDGQTLRGWLQAAPRSPDEVLAVFRQAGEGLAAAHRAGLVHRDFKPDNIMIGDGGAVRVTDFGLARATDMAATQEGLSAPQGLGGALPGGEPQSQEARSTTGAIAGTPTYMAPELYDGTRADARTDQYAFCVSLYESLYGQHPFVTSDRQRMLGAMRGGEIRPPPPGMTRQVGAWIHEVLRRGLRPDPALRFPSMSALLHALDVDPRAMRRRRAQRGALLALLVAAGLFVRALVGPDRTKGPCQGAEALLNGVWDEERRGAARAALLRAGLPGGEAAWIRVSTALDQYAHRWAAHRRDVCEAALRRDLSDGLRDLRMQCLDQRRSELLELTTLFAEGSAQAAQKAEQAAGTLTPLSACMGITLLAAPEPPPSDPAIRARLATLRQQQARVKELTDTDRFGEALALAQSTLVAARAIGYRPLEAELMVAEGRLRRITADRDNEALVMSESEQTFRGALRIAESSRHDLAKLDAMIELIHAMNYRRRLAEAEQVANDARATLERVGGDERRAAALDLALSRVLMNQERYAASDQVLALRERLAGPRDLDIVDVLIEQGKLRLKEGRFREAEDRFRRAMVIQEQVLGPRHSHVAHTAMGLTDALRMQRRLIEAEAAGRRALVLTQAHASPGSLSVALAYGTLAEVLVGLGCTEEALDSAQRAVSTIRADLGPAHPTTWEALLTLAQAQSAAGRHGDARRTARQSVGYVAQGRPAGHAQLRRAQEILKAVLRPDGAARVARHAVCDRPSAGGASAASLGRMTGG
jgi:tetratricopeptide (TPR) repeat protein/predicted Ser/Thr protein kinase